MICVWTLKQICDPICPGKNSIRYFPQILRCYFVWKALNSRSCSLWVSERLCCHSSLPFSFQIKRKTFTHWSYLGCGHHLPPAEIWGKCISCVPVLGDVSGQLKLLLSCLNTEHLSAAMQAPFILKSGASPAAPLSIINGCVHDLTVRLLLSDHCSYSLFKWYQIFEAITTRLTLIIFCLFFSTGLTPSPQDDKP